MEYAKIYRPGKAIQPIKMHDDIQTIGEVELLHFMRDKGNKRKGLVIDLRSKTAYKKETIPSSVNIPSSIKDNKVKLEKVLKKYSAEKAEPNIKLEDGKCLGCGRTRDEIAKWRNFSDEERLDVMKRLGYGNKRNRKRK